MRRRIGSQHFLGGSPEFQRRISFWRSNPIPVSDLRIVDYVPGSNPHVATGGKRRADQRFPARLAADALDIFARESALLLLDLMSFLNLDTSSALAASGRSAEPVRLSKSKFMAGVQCLKRLYFQFNPPEALLPQTDEPEQVEQGRNVGELARTAFPGGIVVDPHLGTTGALAETVALIDNVSVRAVFEAAFRFEGITIRTDILQRQPGNRWRLIEVKSSTGCKDHFLWDILIQRYVLTGCGLDVSSACLMHLNREYVYDGAHHDATKLFTILDLTSEIKALEEKVQPMLSAQRRVLSPPIPPDITPGIQCQAPYSCEFLPVCIRPVPENHISTLPNLSAKKAALLAEAKVSLITEIPPDFALSELQQRVCVSVKSGRPCFSEQCSAELSRLEYPLHFMDFETIFPAIPRHAGMGPYAHIPFQWSLHLKQAQSVTVEHFQFLAEDENDPRRDFFESLSRAIGTRGHIIAYNASFETQRLDDLARWFPEYRARVDQLKSRVWDLLPFVRRNVYHPEFRGSFSLKCVLPALLPELTYKEMEVGNGGQAGQAWERMLQGNTSFDERVRLKRALLAYCRQDTWALVALLTEIRTVTSGTRVS